MRTLKFILSLLFSLGLLFFLNSSHKIDGLPLEVPPLGQLMNPFTGIWQNAEKVGTANNQTLHFPELNGKVTVAYDERMVPHIFAENEVDLAFVQGYVMAQNRLWQMDFLSRFAGGRLGEVLGKRLLPTDQLQRRRGMLWSAKKTVQAWQNNEEDFKALDAFSKGVNAYVQTLSPATYPIEFKILSYEPELWTPLKTALVIKYMALNLASRESDLESTNALAFFGEETFQFLYPEWNPKQDPIIPKGTKFEWEIAQQKDTLDFSTSEAIGFLEHTPYTKPSEFLGSNNWAVAAKKTKNGHPILSSDPHLQLTLPSIWFEAQLHTPEMNAYGVCLPGVPGVIIGFNENIAWGQTNVGHDVVDWYRIKWVDDSKTTYWLDGQQKKVDYVYESYTVKGKKEVLVDTVKYTHWGPIVYENDTLPKHDLAMHWVAHNPGNGEELQFITDLDKADNYTDYSNALTKYETPAQNFVFAARDGDIAIKVNGKLPLKKNQQGRFVQEGDESANGWAGWIPKSQVPQIKNPDRGFVSSANQHSTDTSYPYYYNGGFGDYRGRIANRYLAAMDNITVEDMMKMQNSNLSIFAEELTPLLLANLNTANLTDAQKELVKTLEDWDYHFEKDSRAPVLFQEWWDKFYRMTWDEHYAQRDKMPILFPENWRTIALLENAPDNQFFDDISTPEKETAQEIVTRSFVAMQEALKDKIASPDYNWTEHKGTVIQHLGRIPSFARKIDNGGYRYALNAVSKSNGPSWRMVVELGEEVKAYGVFPGGQSGNPGSQYYDDSVDEWTEGEYHTLFFMKNEQDTKQAILFKQDFLQ